MVVCKPTHCGAILILHDLLLTKQPFQIILLRERPVNIVHAIFITFEVLGCHVRGDDVNGLFANTITVFPELLLSLGHGEYNIMFNTMVRRSPCQKKVDEESLQWSA